MGASSLTSFDQIATVFADYGQSLPGFVRYKLTQQRLAAYTDKKKLRVLDIGGGSGPDAGWLAQRGHRVVVLEPSKKQREYAQRRFNFFLSKTARNRITILPIFLKDLPSNETYDLVLVHGVAMYQADPTSFMEEAIAHVEPGGLFSLVEKGYYGAQARAVRHRDFKALRKLKTTGRVVNFLEQEVWAFRPEELEDLLQRSRFDIVEWHGIRLITDDLRIKVKQLKPAELTTILELEAAHGSHPGIRSQGQMLHFIARKK